MKKLFMVSSGVYSDYMVGGLYESDLNLLDDSVVSKLRLEFHKELGFKQIIECDLMSKHIELVTGEKPPEYKLGQEWRSYNKERERIEDIYRAKVGDLDLSFENWLCRNGVIKKVEYEELCEVI